MPDFSNILDKELIRRIAEGDEDAFGVLVNSYGDILGSHIYRLTHSRETAQEITQDIFLKIWTTRHLLPEVNNIHTWLYVISRNHAMNALRKIAREKTLQEKFCRENIAESESAEESEEQEAWLSSINTAIRHLPPQQQKAYLLSRREGLTYKQIAGRMNLSPETVKKYIQHASHNIARQLKHALNTIALLFFF